MPDATVRESQSRFTFTQCTEEMESSDSEEDDNESVDSGYETDEYEFLSEEEVREIDREVTDTGD